MAWYVRSNGEIFSLLLQDTVLFNMSILENIRCGAAITSRF